MSGQEYHPVANDHGYRQQNPVEVVSPLPQRRMPEVPANMQESLAHLESRSSRVGQLERNLSSASSIQSYAPIQPVSYQRFGPQAPARGEHAASYERTNVGQYQNMSNPDLNHDRQVGYDGSQSLPRSSGTPWKILLPQRSGPNVPMSDEEKEAVLERARPEVMTSNDADTQLAWAQDALQWVEVCVHDRERHFQANTAVPLVEDQICQDATEIVKFLSDQGHPKALFMKGTWMELGKFDYPIEKKEAFRCYQRAANREIHRGQAFGRAEYRMGLLFESTMEMPKAISHYQLGVDLGDAACSYRFGMMTLLGEHGQIKDAQKGLELVRLAADHADENFPQGAYMYGMLLAREITNISFPDDVLPMDIPLAKYYIEKAAYLGFSKAQLKMGQAYEKCQLGCAFDPVLCLHYNALAAKQGESESDMAISKWLLYGQEGLFEKNEEQAFIYASRAAQRELPLAEFAVGYFYENGIFVPLDIAIAKSWYEKAVSHGSQDAATRIERISSEQYMSRADHQTVGLPQVKSLHGLQCKPDPNRVKRKPTPMGGLPEGAGSVSSGRQSVASSTHSPNVFSPNSSQSSRTPSVLPYPGEDPWPTKQQTRGQAPASPLYFFNAVPTRGANGEFPTGSQIGRPLSASGTQPPQYSSAALNNANDFDFMAQRPSTASGSMPMTPSGEGQSRMNQGYAQRRPSPLQSPHIPPGPQQSNGGNQRPQHLQSIGQSSYASDTAYNANFRPSFSTSTSPSQQSQHEMLFGGLPNGGRGTNVRPARDSSMQAQVRNSNAALPHTQQKGPMGLQAPQSGSNSRIASPVSSVPTPQPAALAPAPAATRPPAKTGPKTFDEMGVHVQKKESDCIVM